MAERVRITDVAPRDGLQNEPAPIATDRKAALVRALARIGVDEVEITSFVSPKWIPQLGDAAELCDLLAGTLHDGVVFSALVPNEAGAQRLLDVNRRHADRTGELLITKLAVFTAASEAFSLKNTNASIDETLERFRPVIELAREHDLVVRGYISCVIACPFDGPVSPSAVVDVAGRLLDLGVGEIDLGDTIGAAQPEDIDALLTDVLPVVAATGDDRVVTLHLHDTFGVAAECVRAALDLGVRSFDGAVGGLGGCPYASTPERRAPGNIDTTLLVRTIEAAGFTTGVKHAALDEAATLAASLRSAHA